MHYCKKLPMLREMHVQEYADIAQQKQRWNDEIAQGNTDLQSHLIISFFDIYVPVQERANLLPRNQRSLLAIDFSPAREGCNLHFSLRNRCVL